jgi:hypothetical protein
VTHIIVHICGTMGAGKTTLIRGWMAHHPFNPATRDGSPRPVAYVCAERSFWVMGPYEPDLQTSGCDANKDTVGNYAEVQRRYEHGFCVVYEGLFMMNHTRGLALARAVGTENFHVVRLAEPLEVCRAGVVARRAAQGNHDPLPARFEDGLRGNDVRATNYCHKMKQVGVAVHRVTREQAPGKLGELLG